MLSILLFRSDIKICHSKQRLSTTIPCKFSTGIQHMQYSSNLLRNRTMKAIQTENYSDFIQNIVPAALSHIRDERIVKVNDDYIDNRKIISMRNTVLTHTFNKACYVDSYYNLFHSRPPETIIIPNNVSGRLFFTSSDVKMLSAMLKSTYLVSSTLFPRTAMIHHECIPGKKFDLRAELANKVMEIDPTVYSCDYMNSMVCNSIPRGINILIFISRIDLGIDDHNLYSNIISMMSSFSTGIFLTANEDFRPIFSKRFNDHKIRPYRILN